MKAGTSKLCITPPVGVDLSGYGARVQPSIGVHDDLYVRGLYLEHDAGDRLLWLHCDLLGLDRDNVCKLRKLIVEEHGLPAHSVVMSATHTHAGPATQFLRSCGEMAPEYLAELNRLMIEAARQATGSAEPVTAWFAAGECDVAIDRRRTASAHVDMAMPVLAFRRHDKTFAAIVTNYAMHNVALSSRNRLLSAEMAGVAAQCAHDRLPGNPTVLFTNGACGNINPPRQSDDFSAPSELGAKLGTSLLDLVHIAEECEAPGLSSMMHTVRVPLAVQTVEQVEQEYRYMLSLSDHPRSVSAMNSWRRDTMTLIEGGRPPEYVESEIQTVRIGPACFVPMGAEVFSRMADDLRSMCGKHIYVVGYANGNIGYLPFREAYPEGGYEVKCAYKYYMNFCVAPGGFEMIRDKAAKMVDELG